MEDSFCVTIAGQSISELNVQCTYRQEHSSAVPFRMPMDPEHHLEIRWYLEDFGLWPFDADRHRAARVESSLQTWGNSLLEAVVCSDTESPNEAPRLWEQFLRQHPHGGVVTIHSTVGSVLRLPWELMADDQGPLLTRGILIRRQAGLTLSKPKHPEHSPLTVLMVVARPHDASYINSRTSSLALLEAAASIGENQITIDFLYPPTFDALKTRLADRNKAVTVVHFDGHGDCSDGNGILLFEDQNGNSVPVSVHELGIIVAQSGTPIVVLDACQTAAIENDDLVGSLAPYLSVMGAGSVIAMQYSVLVEASRCFFSAFYAHLLTGDTVGMAVAKAQLAMFEDPRRHRIHTFDRGEWTVELRDWFLPALYQSSDDPRIFAVAHHDGVCRPLSTSRPDADVVPTPLFVGRDREIWTLERLLHHHSVVGLEGLGGQGKTAIARELGDWLRAKRVFDRCVYLDAREADTLSELTRCISAEFCSDDFKSSSATSPQPQRNRVLLIIDHVDSLCSHRTNGSSKQVAQGILHLTRDLLGPHGAMIIVGRTLSDFCIEEEDTPFETYRLQGLSPEDACALVTHTMLGTEDLPPSKPAVRALASTLDGHPLSLEIAAGKLGSQNMDVYNLIDQFGHSVSEWGSSDDQRAVRFREDIALVESTLDSDQLDYIARMGLFEGVASKPLFERITTLTQDEWAPIAHRLASLGLLEIRDYDGNWILRFHPLLAPFFRTRRLPVRQFQYELNYSLHYFLAMSHLIELDRSNAPLARTFFKVEYPNFRRALAMRIRQKDYVSSSGFAQLLLRFLEYEANRWEIELVRRLLLQCGRGEPRGTYWDRMQRWTQEFERARSLFADRRYGEAEDVVRSLLKDSSTHIIDHDNQSRYDRSLTLHLLGRIIHSSRRYDQAIMEYEASLEILCALESDENTTRQVAVIKGDLGFAHEELGNLDEARRLYDESLAVVTNREADRRAYAIACSRRGSLAKRCQHWQDAIDHTTEAIRVFEQLGDLGDVARQRTCMGNIWIALAERSEGPIRVEYAQMANDWFRGAYEVELKIGDRSGAAMSAHNIGQAAGVAERLAECEQWFLEAANQADHLPDRGARTFSCLGRLLTGIHQWPAADVPPEFVGRDLLQEAEVWCERSLEAYRAVGNPAWPEWEPLECLGDIAELCNNPALAQQMRSYARARYARSPNAWTKLAATWDPAIRVAARIDEDPEARPALYYLVDELRSMPHRRRLGVAILELLNGARCADALSDSYNLDRDDALVLVRLAEAVYANS